MNLIVAVTENWGIGKDNKLLFHLPADLAYFKEKTLNKVVVMGEKTYYSLPKRPLPKRTNIVITLDYSFKEEGVIIVHSVEELLNKIKDYDNDDVFVCGGGSIYKLLLPYCRLAYVTKVYQTKDADTFFPNLDTMKEWELSRKGDTQKENDIKFSFDVYKNLKIKE